MNPDYSDKFYKNVGPTFNKEHITEFLNELHEAQLNMIDQAVEYSDLSKAKEVIDYIRGL